MNATHTPGPWTVDGTTIRDSEGRKLAAVGFGRHAGEVSATITGDEIDRNRRLMAAAPDLLDLAFRFVECMSGQLDYGMPHTNEDNPDCQNMRQALALIAQITDQPALCECKHCTAERRANVARCATYEVNREAIDPAGKNRHIERRCSLPPGHLGAHEYGAWVRV